MTQLDRDLILAFVRHRSRSWVMAHGEEGMPERRQERFRSLLQKREAGLPVSYITGHKEFYGLDFFVSPGVLIPKPDTETLVECALEKIRARPPASPAAPLRVLDLCTGSGCVAISLLYNSPQIHVTAVDISGAALRVARENARRLLSAEQRCRLTCLQGDLFAPLPPGSAYDLCVSNPPYVSSADTRILLQDGRGEPALALDGGVTGLELPARLISEAPPHLAPGGELLLEIGDGQGAAIEGFLIAAGFSFEGGKKDTGGTERVVGGKMEKWQKIIKIINNFHKTPRNNKFSVIYLPN